MRQPILARNYLFSQETNVLAGNLWGAFRFSVSLAILISGGRFVTIRDCVLDENSPRIQEEANHGSNMSVRKCLRILISANYFSKNNLGMIITRVPEIVLNYRAYKTQTRLISYQKKF